MTDELFLLDSNILVYAFDASERIKHKKAITLLDPCWLGGRTYAVSLQNLSEFFVTVTSKIPRPISKEAATNIVGKIIAFHGFLKLKPTETSVLRACEMSTGKGTPYWDALLAATMAEHGISHILTENIKDFRNIQGITVVNPFAER